MTKWNDSCFQHLGKLGKCRFASLANEFALTTHSSGTAHTFNFLRYLPGFPNYMPNVLLIDSDRDNAMLESSLMQQSLACVRIPYDGHFLNRVMDIRPDVLVFHVSTPLPALLEDLSQLNLKSPLPVLMFANDAPLEVLGKAVAAAVDIHLVESVESLRLNSLIHIARTRFLANQALKADLEAARDQLEGRKLIDRAKAILIKTQSFSEDQAYHTLRKLAMDRNITLGEMAKNVIAMADLLK
jgi:response regulator NasT